MMQEPHTLKPILEMLSFAAGADDDTSIGERFVSRALELIPAAKAGALWLYSPETGDLGVGASQGYEPDALRQIRVYPGKSIGRAFSSGHSTLYATPSEAAALVNEMSVGARALYKAAAGVEHPQSAIVVPLRVSDTKLGVLALENLRGTRRFTDDDLKQIEYLAGLDALALTNARLSKALREAQAADEKANVRAESISFLAHEMRTPLTTIKGYATALMMEDARFDAATQREFLEQIDRECDTLIRLIEDLLESSVLGAGLLQLEREPVRLTRLVREVVDDIRLTTTKHRFLIEFPREFPLVEADPARLTQVFVNLLENAVKYSPDGGLIAIHGEVQPNQIVLSIADQGIGIAPEHLNRLFEKFFRAKTGAAKATVGSGLGLPIARSIVEAHGGQIWAESQPGHGSIFYIALPLAFGSGREQADDDE